ncbi:MAG: transposase [Bryobacterales bacterium]|nr:transposase [Bryobacterales bacterium]
MSPNSHSPEAAPGAKSVKLRAQELAMLVGGIGLERTRPRRSMRHAARWAHARRKFVEAAKVNLKVRTAVELVQRIDALFAIGAEAREAAMSIEDRHALLPEKAAPGVLDTIPRQSRIPAPNGGSPDQPRES